MVLVVLIVKAVVLLLMRPIVWLTGICRKRYEEWHRSIYFGEIIAILLEGSMEFMICGYINLVNLNMTSDFAGEKLSQGVSYVILALTIIILPIVYIWLLNQT